MGVDPATSSSHRRRLGALIAVALGLVLVAVQARFAFEPSAGPPRTFEFGVRGLAVGSWTQAQLRSLADAVGILRLGWAAASVLFGLVGARSLKRAGWSTGAAICVGSGVGLTAFQALDPGLIAFVAERGFSGAPHYLELEDLLRGVGWTAIALGVLCWFGRGAPSESVSRSDADPRASLVLACAVAGLVPLVWSVWSLDGVPVTNDGLAYRFQADVFAAGEAVYPLVSDDAAYGPAFTGRQLLPIGDTALASKYPPGHSLLLSLGTLFGHARALPILLQGLMPLIVFGIARRLGARRPDWAAWMYALSPTPLALGGLWLSHGTSIPFAAAGIWFGLGALDPERSARRVALDALGCGFCLAVCGAARPGTALAIAIPLVALLALRPARLVRLGPLAVLAATPVVGAFLWIDQRTTGDPLLPAYVEYARTISPDDGWGLTNLATAPDALALNGARLTVWLNGLGLGSLLAWIGLATTRCRHRALLWGTPLALAAFYALLTFHGVPWAGPLYWSEAFALLAVLSAEGLATLTERMGVRTGRVYFTFAAVASASLLAVRAPLATAERNVRTQHIQAAQDLAGDSSWLVEVPLATPLEAKRRFLAPPTEVLTEGRWPRVVFVVEGHGRDLPDELDQRSRARFDVERGVVEPR